MSGARLIVIGDVHGCAAELTELIERLAVQPADRLIFLGDLIDHGPSNAETVRAAREIVEQHPGSQLILGNHEQKLLRQLARNSGGGSGRPWVDDLSEADLLFLRGARLYDRDVARDLVFVHGGFYPAYFHEYGRLPDPERIDELDAKHRQRLSRFTMIRHVNSAGQMVSLGGESEGTHFWAAVYDGREGFACFGHAAGMGTPRLYPFAVCLDTGCVFGGTLTAAVFGADAGDRQFVSVKARKVYAKFTVANTHGANDD